MECGRTCVGRGYAGCSYKRCKALVGMGLVSLVLLLVLGTMEELDGHAMERSAALLAARSSMVDGNMKLQVVIEEEKKPNEEEHADDHMTRYRAASPAARSKDKVDINYMSKRRVPNGADPIHNRRAGKSRRPPSKT